MDSLNSILLTSSNCPDNTNEIDVSRNVTNITAGTMSYRLCSELPVELLINEILAHLSFKDVLSACSCNKSMIILFSNIDLWTRLLRSTSHLQLRNLVIQIAKNDNFPLFRAITSSTIAIDDDTYHIALSYFFLANNSQAVEYTFSLMNKEMYSGCISLKDKENAIKTQEVITKLKQLVCEFSPNSHEDKDKSAKFIDDLDKYFDKNTYLIHQKVISEVLLDCYEEKFQGVTGSLVLYADHFPIISGNSYHFFKLMIENLVNKGLRGKSQVEEILKSVNWSRFISDIIFAIADDEFLKQLPNRKPYSGSHPLMNKSPYKCILEMCSTYLFEVSKPLLDHPFICFDPEEFLQLLATCPNNINGDALTYISEVAKKEGRNKWSEKLEFLIKNKYSTI